MQDGDLIYKSCFCRSVRFQHRRLALQSDHMRHGFEWWGSCKSMSPSWENMMLNVYHQRKAVVAASSLNMHTWSDLFAGFGQCPWEQAARCCKTSQVSVTEDPWTQLALSVRTWLQWVQIETVFYMVHTGAAPLFALGVFRNRFKIKEEVSVCKLELLYFECGLWRHPCPWTECPWIVRQLGMDLIGPECSVRPNHSTGTALQLSIMVNNDIDKWSLFVPFLYAASQLLQKANVALSPDNPGPT